LLLITSSRLSVGCGLLVEMCGTDFFKFQLGFDLVFEKTQIPFGMSLVWIGLKKMILYIYYLCNTRVVNLLQILQRCC